jgi:hypothetical protein
MPRTSVAVFLEKSVMLKLLATVFTLVFSLSTSASAETVLRIGHFPNITHVQALIAHNLSRNGKGWYSSISFRSSARCRERSFVRIDLNQKVGCPPHRAAALPSFRAT